MRRVGVTRKTLIWITYPFPRGSIYTTILELSPERPSPLWFWDPNSIIGIYIYIYGPSWFVDGIKDLGFRVCSGFGMV